MRVEQAIYGEVSGGGHGLRVASPGATSAEALASKLDLPDSIPFGVQDWSPFVRGFAAQGHYVLARTFADPMAKRGGMVLTHALFIRLDEMCGVGNLVALFAALRRTAAECVGSLKQLEILTSTAALAQPIEVVGIVNALVTSAQGPVVRVGVSGFEDLVDALWRVLWPSARRTFSFRLSFGPNDVATQPPPALVCTPAQLQGQWTKHTVANPSAAAPVNESAEVLLGYRDIAPILELAADLGFEIQSFRTLTHLVRLQTLLAPGDTFDTLLEAIRLTEGLASSPEQGAALKDSLIERFRKLLAGAQAKQLMQLRNLDLPGFPNALRLWTAVKLVVGSLKFTPCDDAIAAEMLVAASKEGQAGNPWRSAIKAGVSVAAGQSNPTIFAAVWRWAKVHPEAYLVAVGALPSALEVEERFVQAAPVSLGGVRQDQLLPALQRKGWGTAHGAAVSAILPPLEAVQRQLTLQPDSTQSVGVRTAMRNASPTQMLECALKLKDVRLVDLCAAMAVEKPETLSDIRCTETIEQQIWAAAIGKDANLCNAPRNSAAVRDTVMGALASGHPVYPGLLEALSHTALANLSNVPEREKLWAALPATDLPRYLCATAAGWLGAAMATNLASPERELEQAIVASPVLHQTLGDSRRLLEVRLAIIGALPSFTENAFKSWLGSTLTSARILSSVQAAQLGNLINARRWGHAAADLVQRHSRDHRQDLLPALHACQNLLSGMQRWRLKLSAPSVNEKWADFEREACELYPAGPDHDELWSRAGGKNYLLLSGAEDGATRWHSALRSVRYGSKPLARDLLNEMIRQYPNNENLRMYAADEDIVRKSSYF